MLELNAATAETPYRWDQMFRATLNYGRKGLPIQCISAVDLALWDLLGKLRNARGRVSTTPRREVLPFLGGLEDTVKHHVFSSS